MKRNLTAADMAWCSLPTPFTVIEQPSLRVLFSERTSGNQCIDLAMHFQKSVSIPVETHLFMCLILIYENMGTWRYSSTHS